MHVGVISTWWDGMKRGKQTLRENWRTSTLGDVDDSSLFIRVAQDAGAVLNGLVYAVGTIILCSLGRLTAADLARLLFRTG